MSSDTSITINFDSHDEQSKIDTLMNMIRQQKEKLEERDKTMNQMLEKVERDRTKIQLQAKEIEELKLSMSQQNLTIAVEREHGESMAQQVLNISSGDRNANEALEPLSPSRSAMDRNQLLAKLNDQLRHKNLEIVTKLSHLEDVMATNRVDMQRSARENSELRAERDSLKMKLEEVTIQLQDLQNNQKIIDDRMTSMKKEYNDQRSKLTENKDRESVQLQEERKKIEEEFSAIKTTLTNQKQRLELENKALGVSLTTKSNELEQLKEQYDDFVEEKTAELQQLTAEAEDKERRLKSTSEELFTLKREVMELRMKHGEGMTMNQTLRNDLLKSEQKYLQLQQQYDNLKKFTSAYLEALQKDVQVSVERSTNGLVRELEFYKSEYRLLKDFLQELRDVIRSRGPLENWMNVLFPE